MLGSQICGTMPDPQLRPCSVLNMYLSVHSGVQTEGSNPKGLAYLVLLHSQGADVSREVNHLSSPHIFISEALFLCLVLKLGSWVCLSSLILSDPILTCGPFEGLFSLIWPCLHLPCFLLLLPSFLSYCLLSSLFLGSRMSQLLPTNCPTAMVSSILEGVRVKQWGLSVTCAVSPSPKFLDLGFYCR